MTCNWEAEQWYRHCFETEEGQPGDRLLWKANFTYCLWLQGKLDEGLELLVPSFQDRWDTSTYEVRSSTSCSTISDPPCRAGNNPLFALGNIEKFQAEDLLQQAGQNQLKPNSSPHIRRTRRAPTTARKSLAPTGGPPTQASRSRPYCTGRETTRKLCKVLSIYEK